MSVIPTQSEIQGHSSQAHIRKPLGVQRRSRDHFVVRGRKIEDNGSVENGSSSSVLSRCVLDLLVTNSGRYDRYLIATAIAQYNGR